MPRFKASLLILVVEDDERMRDLLCRGLRDFGHTAMPASDGGAGLDLAMAFAFDVIVLDVGLPIRDGYEIARTIREQGRLAPILMLTARDSEDDIIRGLESGADDYLLKPFSFPELVARLRVLSRATLQITASSALILDPSRLTATRGKTSISLTRHEFLLLSLLHEQANRTVSRESLMQVVWGERKNPRTNALDVLVNSLRTKLDDPFAYKMIETIRGFGYRLDPNAVPALSHETPLQPTESEHILQKGCR